MKILAMDSSGLVASVAVLDGDILLGEYTMNYKKTHSETLLPMLNELAEKIELDLTTIDAIALAAGPGSFTGLRIGSATAKGLGLALDKPLVAVPTVAGLAYNCYGTDRLVCPLMDARRSQTYTGIYRFVNRDMSYEMETVLDQCAVGIDEIIDRINELGQPVIFLGDGQVVFTDYIEEHCSVPYTFAPSHMNRQRAASVAALGMRLLEAGQTVSAADHRPEYLRLSQAERERLERGQSIDG